MTTFGTRIPKLSSAPTTITSPHGAAFRRRYSQRSAPTFAGSLIYYGKQQFRQGQVVVTTGGDWNRRALIHAAVIDLDENRYPTVDVIHGITRRILDCAVALGARSIALPVLGGGYATRFLRSSDSVNAIASEVLAFMGGRHHLTECLKRIALYMFDRADADGLPKELMEDAGTAS
jgi:O-acetyl-ADP-ribose deacetylase (regulator of RNase III)